MTNIYISFILTTFYRYYYNYLIIIDIKIDSVIPTYITYMS